MTWILILSIFLLGIWGMIWESSLIKKVMAFNILNSAVVLMFVYTGSLSGTSAPIMVRGVSDVVDPLPQALMLTAIVVGVCVTALALVLLRIIYRCFGTLDIRAIEAKIRSGHE